MAYMMVHSVQTDSTNKVHAMITLPAGYPTDLIAAFDSLKTRKAPGCG